MVRVIIKDIPKGRWEIDKEYGDIRVRCAAFPAELDIEERSDRLEKLGYPEYTSFREDFIHNVFGVTRRFMFVIPDDNGKEVTGE